MAAISKSQIVPYTSLQMFELVNHIEAYPEFIPYCYQSDILSKNEDEIRATLHFAAAGVTKSFTTRNLLQAHKMVEIRLIDGPFKQLEGFWRFETVEKDYCRVKLDLNFEFSNRLLGMAFGPMFNQIASSLVDSFVNRAKTVYADVS